MTRYLVIETIHLQLIAAVGTIKHVQSDDRDNNNVLKTLKESAINN